MTEQTWYKHKSQSCKAEGTHFFTKRAYGNNEVLLAESVPASENEVALAILRNSKQYYFEGVLSEIIDDQGSDND
jgi:hypothetical protein